jgi:hypothetical protein
MPKMRSKVPKGVQVRKNGTLLICYKNEFGKIIREDTGQSDVKAAELMLAQARTDVAKKERFTALSFESVKFIDLFKPWWTNHGSRTRSKIQYRTPRVIARFGKKKAREVSPDAVRDFLADLRNEHVHGMFNFRALSVDARRFERCPCGPPSSGGTMAVDTFGLRRGTSVLNSKVVFRGHSNRLRHLRPKAV